MAGGRTSRWWRPRCSRSGPQLLTTHTRTACSCSGHQWQEPLLRLAATSCVWPDAAAAVALQLPPQAVIARCFYEESPRYLQPSFCWHSLSITIETPTKGRRAGAAE